MATHKGRKQNIYTHKYRKEKVLNTKRLPRKEIIESVASICGITSDYYDTVRQIIDAYDFVLKQGILTGYKVPIKGIGWFGHYEQRGHAAGEFYNVYHHRMEYRDKRPDFIRPLFQFTEDFLDELKELTVDTVVAPQIWSRQVIKWHWRHQEDFPEKYNDKLSVDDIIAKYAGISDVFKEMEKK